MVKVINLGLLIPKSNFDLLSYSDRTRIASLEDLRLSGDPIGDPNGACHLKTIEMDVNLLN